MKKRLREGKVVGEQSETFHCELSEYLRNKKGKKIRRKIEKGERTVGMKEKG